jgi:ABC-2 type transport system permease protein
MRSRYFSVAGGVAWRNLHNYVGNPALLLPSLMFPLFFFTAFAGGLSRVSDIPQFHYSGGYTAFQFCFVLLQASAFGGVFTGFGIARDFESGFGRRMMLASPHRSAIVVGYAASALARAGIVWVLLTGIALATGMQVGGSGIDLLGMFGLAALVNIAAGLWAAGIALRFRTLQASPLMQTPVFLVLFLAPVYLPLDLLAGWIHSVASVNPTTLLVETARGLITGDTTHVLAAFGAAAGLVAVFVAWSMRGLRKAEAAGS